jgi:hypothetical protein
MTESGPAVYQWSGPPAVKPGHGLAIAGFVCAIVGVIFGLIPLTFILAFIGGALGLIFGLIGRRHGLGKAAVVLGVVALVLGVIGVVIVNRAVDKVTKDLNSIAPTTAAAPSFPGATISDDTSAADASAAAAASSAAADLSAILNPTSEAPPPPVVYTVRTDGSGFSNITYFEPETGNIGQATDVAGKTWTKSLDGANNLGNNLSVQGNGSGSWVECVISQGGKVLREQKSTGPYSIASCG